MNEYKRSDMQEPEISCQICYRNFKSKTGLRRHEKVVHSGKAFATKEQQIRHENAKHTHSKPFACEKGCSKRFASSSARIYHHKVVHDGEKFRCDFPGCMNEFSSHMNLRRHFQKNHQEAYNYWNWVYQWTLFSSHYI